MIQIEMIMQISAVLQVVEFVVFLAILPIAVKEVIKSERNGQERERVKKNPYESPIINFTDEDTAFLLEYTRRTQDLSDVVAECPK